MNKRQKKRNRVMHRFTRLLNFGGWFAKRLYLTPITNLIMRLLADLTFFAQHGQQRVNLKEIGQEWQRMFPSKAFVPIKETTDETVFAEIHGTCPVTDTGDIHACYRLMEYDRRLLQRIGGEFAILESKADSTVSVCRIAIRSKGASMDDLRPIPERF